MEKNINRIKRAQKLILSGRLNKMRAITLANWLERAVWHESRITTAENQNRQDLPEKGNNCLLTAESSR